jgi:hypothetical protein
MGPLWSIYLGEGWDWLQIVIDLNHPRYRVGQQASPDGVRVQQWPVLRNPYSMIGRPGGYVSWRYATRHLLVRNRFRRRERDESGMPVRLLLYQ